jgi:hypothetical protein
MLPLTLQFPVAMVACAISERQQRALEYKTEEVLVLKAILKSPRKKGRPPKPKEIRDLVNVEILGIFGAVRYSVFFVMELKTRTVEIAGIRVNPDGEWMKQAARNLTDPVDGARFPSPRAFRAEV